MLYVVPTFKWVESGDGLTRERVGRGLRVYLDRPWYSSGDGELLGHSQRSIAEGLNLSQKILRMRARPKILLATSWEAKKRMSNRITNAHIDEIYAEARAAGALGGKVTGAGGGGYVLVYCGDRDKHRIA